MEDSLEARTGSPVTRNTLVVWATTLSVAPYAPTGTDFWGNWTTLRCRSSSFCPKVRSCEVTTTGTVVTLSNTNTTNKIDIALNTAFVVNTAKATGTFGLSGTSISTFSFKVGTGSSSTADNISVSINSVDASALSVGGTVISSEAEADAASVAVSNAIDDLQTYRANIGANQNRLEFAAANLHIAVENSEAARSQLLDLDVAAEMSDFVSRQILIQAGVSMLAQANEMPHDLLRLFQ